MPKHAAHATLERERTRSRIVDDEPAPPAALEECLGVLPLADDDFEMLDIVGVGWQAQVKGQGKGTLMMQGSAQGGREVARGGTAMAAPS